MGLEPTSLQSQYNILPLKLLSPLLWHWRDLNPQALKPKFNVFTNSTTMPTGKRARTFIFSFKD